MSNKDLEDRGKMGLREAHYSSSYSQTGPAGSGGDSEIPIT